MKHVVCIILAFSSLLSAQVFYDDFEDDYIGDWEERCQPAYWYASDGMAHCIDALTPSALVIPGGLMFEDCQLETYGTATHVFGLVARLDSSDSGVFAIVSPDHDVARIRLVQNGYTTEILNSLYYDFPSGVDYKLTFTCLSDSLHLLIEVPDLGQSWELVAFDPYTHSGEVGILGAQEPHASWDWFSATQISVSESGLWACTVDDDGQGGSSGDGDMAFEAGETVEFDVAIYNGGPEPLENAFAVIQSLASEIQVPVSSAEFGDIAAGSYSWSESCFIINSAPDAPEGLAYPMRLSLFADGGYFSQHDFELPLGAGCSTSFETSIEDWSWYPVDAGWGDQWHVSENRNHTPGGSSSFKCGDTGGGDYSDHLYAGLESPCFNAALGSTLTFWMWIDAQCTRAAGEALDGGRLQIGQFGNWQDLFPSDDYPYQIVSGTTGPFEPGTGVYSGYEGWQMITVDIPDSLCGPRHLRWVFGSDNEGNREGWYIDDVLVFSDQVPVEGSGALPVLSGLSLYPNPCGSMMHFQAGGPSNQGVLIEVYDVSGRKVWEHSGQLDAHGGLELSWNLVASSGGRIPPGIYTAIFSAGAERTSRRMVVTEPRW